MTAIINYCCSYSPRYLVVGSISGHSTANLPIGINHNHPCIEKKIIARQVTNPSCISSFQILDKNVNHLELFFYAVELITKPRYLLCQAAYQWYHDCLHR